MAVESYGSTCVMSSDIDEDARKTYEMNFGQRPNGDISKIKSEEIPAHDFVCAGLPCQSFSLAGLKAGLSDPRGQLFFEIVRIVRDHQPSVVLIENVRNLLRHGDGRTWYIMNKALSSVGYDVYAKNLVASDFGVPQRRDRAYVVAFRKDLGVTDFQFPKPNGIITCVADILEPEVDLKKYAVQCDDIVFFDNAEAKIKASRGTKKLICIGTYGGGKQGQRVYDPSGQGVTLTASGGGRGGTSGLYRINGIVRNLTPVECRRMMGFPESYQLPENERAAYKQLGNSVAVPVLMSILEQVEVALAIASGTSSEAAA